MPAFPDDPFIDADLFVAEMFDALDLLFANQPRRRAFIVVMIRGVITLYKSDTIRRSQLETLRTAFAAAADAAE